MPMEGLPPSQPPAGDPAAWHKAQEAMKQVYFNFSMFYISMFQFSSKKPMPPPGPPPPSAPTCYPWLAQQFYGTPAPPPQQYQALPPNFGPAPSFNQNAPWQQNQWNQNKPKGKKNGNWQHQNQQWNKPFNQTGGNMQPLGQKKFQPFSLNNPMNKSLPGSLNQNFVPSRNGNAAVGPAPPSGGFGLLPESATYVIFRLFFIY